MKLRHAKQKSHKPVIIIVAVCAAIAMCIAIAVIIIANRTPTATEPTAQTTVATETTPPTEETTTPQTEETTAATEPLTETTPENNPEFISLLDEGGYSPDDLSGTQLIVVKSEGSNAQFSFFEKKDGAWDYADVLNTVDGFVGTQGVSTDASEYASYTPKGLFPLGTGFGINDDPGTSLDYFKVTENSYWIDDVNSQYYNQHVEADPNATAPKGEHLIDYKGYYDYAVFIGYNSDPAVPGKGSAFFLHAGNEPTAGCAAIPEGNMLNALKWLNKNEKPYILIF